MSHAYTAQGGGTKTQGLNNTVLASLAN